MFEPRVAFAGLFRQENNYYYIRIWFAEDEGEKSLTVLYSSLNCVLNYVRRPTKFQKAAVYFDIVLF